MKNLSPKSIKNEDDIRYLLTQSEISSHELRVIYNMIKKGEGEKDNISTSILGETAQQLFWVKIT